MIKLVIRSLLYYRRQHRATILAIAMCTAILTGALIIGDSVRGSLRNMVTERLGKTTYALELNHRHIHLRMVDKLQSRLGTTVIPLLNTGGILRNPEKKEATRNVNIYGIDSRFGKISGNMPNLKVPAEDQILINQSLARQLDLAEGDEILLRFTGSGFLPGDVPIAGNSKRNQSARFTIAGILKTEQQGNFSLRTNQVAAANVFISLAFLGNQLKINDHVNIVLIVDDKNKVINQQTLTARLQEIWNITDAGFDLVLLEQNRTELRSKNIFINKAISEKISESGPLFSQVFTYFANSLFTDTRSTPYSFVSAAGPEIVPAALLDSEIIINQWLADDLDLAVGDSMRISYFIPTQNNTLFEDSRSFRVFSIVPMRGNYTDRNLMPDFPGLADVENCRDWEPGIPLDLDLIRTKDETYWDRYRGVPKAFVTLKAAKEMWQNRFGDCTAIRINSSDTSKIQQDVSKLISPEELGIRFRPVREEALQAGAQSVDFSELFLGLSFFIIVSALLLTSLIYKLNIEHRSQETDLFFALGFNTTKIRTIMLYEGMFLSIISAALGILLAMGYTKFVLYALNSVWQDAVGTSGIMINITFSALLTGFFISITIIMLTILTSVRSHIKTKPSPVIATGFKTRAYQKFGRGRLALIFGILSMTAACILILTTDAGRGKEAVTSFFISGLFTLAGGLTFVYYILAQQKDVQSLSSIFQLARLNSSRNITRSLILVAMLSSSLFIVFTVGANRTGNISDISNRKSGTGGFALFGQTISALPYNLNTSEGKNFLDLNDPIDEDIKFVHFRLRDGDDASCLNLHRISRPKILGVDPEELYRRGAFGFITKVPELADNDPWQALDEIYPDHVIPGIADETVIIWGLGKSVGDTLYYSDEFGNILKIKLIAGLTNSIFQGHVIISEKKFLQYFPSISGYRVFLTDGNKIEYERITGKLSWALQDYGLRLESTAQRLSEFNKVQNTYLSIFLILGSFAIILGTIGVGIVLFRNVLERKNELAILRAVGYNIADIRQVLFTEHAGLLFLGILIGFISSVISILPALLSPDFDTPVPAILFFLLIITFSGAVWTYLATRNAVSGDLIDALQND